MFNLGRPRHLLVHLALEERAPELLGKEVLVHFQLVGVFVVVGGLVTNLLLAGVALDASLERGLLIVERFQHRGKSVLPLEVILVDKSHQLFKTMLGLKSLLLGLSVLIRLFLVDLSLVLVAVLCLVEADLDGNQITLHATDHVQVGALHHHLVLVRVLYTVKGALSVRHVTRLVCIALLDVGLVALGLLQLTLLGFKLLLFFEDCLVDVVILLADAPQRRTDFLVLLITELPGGDHIVGLEERVRRHKVVLRIPVIVPVKFVI